MSLPINQIICGDCLDVMKDWPDGCVDLVLTDPPYGVGVEYDVFDDTQEAVKKLAIPFVRESQRVSRLVVFTSGVINAWHYPQPDWVMAWVNKAGANSGPWGFSCWQPILCYGPEPHLKNGMGRRHDIIMANERAERLGHPCPKPINFWYSLLRRVSVLYNDVIIDPFCGSGTTCVAAKMLGRDYIGIDISEEYCKIARERLEAVDTGVPVKEARAGQMALFGERK